MRGGPEFHHLPLFLHVVAVCCWVVAKSGVAWLSPRDSEAAKCGVAPGVALCVAQPGRAIVADEIVTGIIMGAAADWWSLVSPGLPWGSEGGLLLMRLQTCGCEPCVAACCRLPARLNTTRSTHSSLMLSRIFMIHRPPFLLLSPTALCR